MLKSHLNMTRSGKKLCSYSAYVPTTNGKSVLSAFATTFGLRHWYHDCAAHLPAIKALPPGCTILRAVYSRSDKSASGFAEYATKEFDYSKVIDLYSEDSGDNGVLLDRKGIHTVRDCVHAYLR
jgi:hypothetical protein